MDPDIPVPSVETREHGPPPDTNKFAAFRDTPRSPLASSSPGERPHETPRPHSTTPATIKASPSPLATRNGHRSTPDLHPKRSSSSLSVARGQTPSKLQLRRVSSNLNPSSPTVTAIPADAMPVPARQQVALSAEVVAKDFFQRELQTHTEGRSKTVVIVHDSCYGHRFARPRTSKAALSTIVERPERIHATLLGAATAYVRLGNRHMDGAYGPHPARDVKTLPDPPFLLQKTVRSIPLDHPAVTHIHGSKWMEELQIMCDTAEAKLSMNGKELSRPIGFGKDEDGKPLPKLHEGDLYLCAESLAALQGCLGGVCDAVDTVFSPSATTKAFVCIRPPGHHCSANYPSGFCWLNNVHVGISHAAINHGLTHAAIIDFDLHHGDGSQTITWDHNRKAQTLPKNAAQFKKTPIGYYSLHDINSYPCEWGDEEKVRNASLCIDNAHGQSIWNVHLEPWTSLEQFWQLYETKYRILLEKTKLFLQHHAEKLRATGVRPRAAIFLSAGFDASQWEGQGMQRHNVNIPTEFYAKFTSDIVEVAAQPDLGVDNRVISVLEGGYSDRALMSGVFSHLCGLTHDNSHLMAQFPKSDELATSPGLRQPAPTVVASGAPLYEPDWWSEINLEAIERRVAGNIVPPLQKKDKMPGNYSSPTHASTARMTEVARERSSLSAQAELRMYLESVEPEPPQPVDWITAAYELSQILIPQDRQTLSYRHDELNAESTKVRRERQSAIGVAVPPEKRMQLRTRGKGPVTEPDNVRVASRTSNRRTTIAAVSELPDPSMPAARPRRRSSAASSILSGFQDMRLNDGNAELPTSTQQASTVPDIERNVKMGPPAKKVITKINTPRKAKVSAQSASRISAQTQRTQITKEGDEPMSQATLASTQVDGVSPPAQNGIDDLTNGMKKISIKLKMPNHEQHTANQGQSEEMKAKKARLPRKPPVPKLSRSKPAGATTAGTSHIPLDQGAGSGSLDDPVGTSGVKPNFPQVASDNNPNTRHHDPHGTTFEIDDRPHNEVAASRPPIPSPHKSLDVGRQSLSISDMSGLLQSSDGSEPAERILTAAQTEPQDSGTLAKRTKAELPVFTSNSPIPFSHAATHVVDHKESQPRDASTVWEVPETPRR